MKELGIKELEDIAAEERKATAHVIIEGTSRDQVMPVSIAGKS